MASKVTFFLASCLMLLSGNALEAGDDLIVIQNGDEIGQVAVDTAGNRVRLEYRTRQNSRGPTLDAELILGPEGIPVDWEIEGTSLMGGAVEERFRQNDGHAQWFSQADQGRIAVDEPRLYVANDGTPWDPGLYARVLLEAEDHSLDVLPSGRMTLVLLDEFELSNLSEPVSLTVYRLGGLGLEPDYLMLDADRALFALHRGRNSLVIREGFAEHAESISGIFEELRFDDIEQTQQSLVHRFSGPIYIRNVRVFQPDTGDFTEPVTVVTFDDRIVDIRSDDDSGPSSENSVIVDGEGGYLIPGLHDMHSHTSLMSGMYYLAAGITATRDMGNNNTWLLEHLARQESGELIGPHITRTGFIEGHSEHSARLGKVVSSLDEAFRAVDWYADHGYEWIKLYSSVEPEWIEPVIARAKEHAMRVTGHIPAFVHPEDAVTHGYDDIAHINQLVLGWLLDEGEDSRTTLRLTAMKRTRDIDLESESVRQTIQKMRDHDVALDTTAVILERLMKSRAGETPPGDRDYLNHAPIGYQRYRKRTFVPLDSEGDDRAYLESADKLLDIIGLLQKSGIQLLPGTDDTTGFTLHRELELYNQAGIPAAEVLRIATRDAARYLGQGNDTGAIERGRRADLVLLGHNPIDDIRALKRPRMVLKDGDIYFPDEIYRALGFEPFASAPSLRQASEAP